MEAVYGPGDLLGDRAFFHAEPHTATVSVVTRCVLLRIPVEELDALFAKDYKLAARFLQLLAKRWSVMGTRQPERGSRVRRVVSLLSLEHGIDSLALVERLAAALSEISHQQVLLVHFSRNEAAGEHDWAKHDHYLDGEFRLRRHVRSSGAGFCEMRLPVGGDPQYAAGVAPLISHCGRHYDYVLLHGDADLPERTAREVVLQADLAYVLIRPQGPDLAQFDLLVRSLHDSSAYATRHIRPVVFSSDPNRAATCDAALKRSAKLPGHNIYHFPSSNSGSDADRAGVLCINRMARDIARCRIGLALSSGGAKGPRMWALFRSWRRMGSRLMRLPAPAWERMSAHSGLWASMGLNSNASPASTRDEEVCARCLILSFRRVSVLSAPGILQSD